MSGMYLCKQMHVIKNDGMRVKVTLHREGVCVNE